MNTQGAALHGRIKRFGNEWRQLSGASPLADRLTHFFTRSDGLLGASAIGPEAVDIDTARLGRLVAALSPSLAAMQARGTYPNPWTAAGIKRDEVRNTSALAFLWDARRSGPSATEFLAEFLSRISPGTNRLPIRELLDGGYHVRVEDSPLGLASERIDLTIESARVLLGIEVKIRAGLGREQLQRYADTVRRRAAPTRRMHRVILLAPFASPVAEVVSASWGDVVAAARAVLPRPPERTFTHHLIDRFAEHVSSWKE